MFKTKLFATICAAASAVTVAVTAITLAVAGPAGLQTVNTLSPNDQIASSIAGVFNSASDSKEVVTELVETITSNKTATNIGFTINSLDGVEGAESLQSLAGFGGNLEFQLDTESQAAALLFDATLGSLNVIDGTIYIDKNQVLTAAPFLFEGVLKASIDNLESDLQNSYVGQLIADEIDFDELKEAYELFLAEYETMAPDFDFDSEKFMDGLTDTMSDSFDNAMDAMDADDLGMKKLNGGSYQAYYAKIPVRELSYIVRDSITYCLNSSEFQSLVDQIIDYYVETTGMSEASLGISVNDLKEAAVYVDTFWPSIVTGLEDILGKNIELTIYITETVELAGLKFNAYVRDDKLEYGTNHSESVEASMELMCDFTGGKNIGDYTDITASIAGVDADSAIIHYTKKSEPNGDFSIVIDATSGMDSFGMTIDGNFVVDGKFFSLDVDSIKLIEGQSTLIDLGFSIGFKPIDAIAKPSGTPEYDLWEMDEDDFEDLLLEIQEKLEEYSDILE